MGDCFKIIEVKSFGRRRFYDIPTKVQNKGECNETDDKDMNSHHSVLRFLAQDLIGKNSCLKGPYGQRMIVYCDYIASGRALNSIENYIQQHILPTYGNTHTTTTVTSLQSSMFMQESRSVKVHEVCRARLSPADILRVRGKVVVTCCCTNFEEGKYWNGNCCT